MSRDKTLRRVVISVSLIALWSSLSVSAVNYSEHPKTEQFIKEMVQEHQYDEKFIRDVLVKAERKDSILEAIARPAEKTMPWHKYRSIFLTDKRITKGKAFLIEHKKTFDAVEEKYNIPRELIAAIIGVETFYGGNMGSYRVIDALTTLGFDYPKRSLFYRELKNYFLMVRDNDLDPLALKGSYAGAMGFGQFIPSSYISYAVDYDGDGKKELWSNIDDAIASVAYYFKRYGWVKGAPVASLVTLNDSDAQQYANDGLSLKGDFAHWKERGVNLPKNVDDQKAALYSYQQTDKKEFWLGYKNFYVITRYNRSRLYVRAVHELSQALKN